MDLILWRHADAEPHGSRPDLERALSEEGEAQASRMAAWLNARLDPQARILASPARRAQQTASALGRAIRTVEAVTTDVSARSVLEAAGWPGGQGTVVVVGHQPTLGMVASLALTGRAEGWSVDKAAAWWLRRDRGDVVLVAVQSPALL